MTLEVRYFQMLRAVAGAERESVEVPDGASVGDLIDRVTERHPKLAAVRSSILIAVNQEHSGAERRLNSGDEVAFMPPFSGG